MAKINITGELEFLENKFNDIHSASNLLSSQDISTDLLSLLCGKKLGAGSTRAVYEFNLSPEKYVVKIEPNVGLANAQEALIWNEVQGLVNKKAWVKNWFAPIHFLSPNGKILIMSRTKIKPVSKSPDKVPAFFTDVHPGNFGWIGNRFVCHDYAFIYSHMEYFDKLKKANWHKYD
jgi:hypothetical protein